MNPLVAQLTHLPFPEVAEALREGAERITLAWDATVREAMPQMRHLTSDESEDSTHAIMLAIADALASDDPEHIRDLMTHAPAQGLSRFHLKLDVLDVMQEDRLLRAITVQHVEEGLGRRMDVPESAALHAAIDVMLQRSVIAFVDEQKAALRVAAETELKFLAFMSHDLNNNLNGITLLLQVLKSGLQQTGGFADEVESLRHAQQAIDRTVTGMRRMLDEEWMRQAGEAPALAPVDLHALTTGIADQIAREAGDKGVAVAVEVPPGTVVESEAELITVVLQNLVGNAVKYSDGGGRVRIGCDEAAGRRRVWVSDEGPGIAPEKVGRIFEAFKRGDVHGRRGVGLGLAIASQGAKLLNAELTVESKLGAGSTFKLSFAPDASR